MENGDEIKDLFSKSFENFEKEVDPGLWDKIQTNLNSGVSSGSASKAGKSGLIKAIVVGTVSVASITAGVLIFSNSDNNKTSDTDVEKIDSNVIENPNKKENRAVEDLVVIDNNALVVEKIEESRDPLIIKEKEEIRKSVLTDIKEEAPIDYSDVDLNDLLDQDLLNELNKKDQNKANENRNEKVINANNVTKVNNDEKLIEEHIIADSKVQDLVKGKSEAEAYLEKLPNVLTPNGDGINDIMTIKHNEIESLEFLLFDQSGRNVYEKSGKVIRYDGSNLGGEKLIGGSYRMLIVAKTLSGQKLVKKSLLYIRK